MRIFLIILFIVFPSISVALPDAPTSLASGDPSWTLDATLPQIIYDDNLEGWVVETFLGNYVTSNLWYDGPRKEVGGIRNPDVCTQGDGVIYCSFASNGEYSKNIVAVNETTGVARLLMHWTGKEVGDIEEVKGGLPFYRNGTLYILGHNCLRKMVDDGDGTFSVALVAGECGTPCVSNCDGTGAAARFGYIQGWAATDDGTVYLISASDFTKTTSAGVVTYETLTRADSPTKLWQFLPGHSEHFSLGEDNNTLYLADNYNTTAGKGILTIDLTTNVITKIAGEDPDNTYERGGVENDGPANGSMRIMIYE